MKRTFTPSEQKPINHAKEKIAEYNTTRHKRGGIDTLYSFALSKRGNFYDGSCLESNLSHASICAE